MSNTHIYKNSLKSKIVVGVDVGGTNIHLGLINPRGTIIARTHLVTKSCSCNKKELIRGIVERIKILLSENKYPLQSVAGIGIGLPGLIDPRKGLVKFLPNIPGWKDVPLKKILQEKTRLKTFLENDVNLITLGEWCFGAGAGVQNMICMTLGTGVGGGFILDGHLYRGEGFAAGEIGHIPINEEGPRCNCGGYGCLERTVGNRYLLQRVSQIFKKKMSLEDVYLLAQKGNRKALRFWEETATHIGNGLTGVVNILNPPRIVIGGGVANAHTFLFKTIEKTIRKRAMRVQGKMFRIVKARLGNDAGLIGARVLVLEELKARA